MQTISTQTAAARPARRRARRATVEGALTLDVDRLVRRRVLAPGARTRGVVSWTDAAGRPAASVAYEADMADARAAWLRLRYSTPGGPGGGPRQVDQRVPLASTRPPFGGLRWWFVDAGARVGRLHLPPGGDRFRSRRAHGLVYASQYSAS